MNIEDTGEYVAGVSEQQTLPTTFQLRHKYHVCLIEFRFQRRVTTFVAAVYVVRQELPRELCSRWKVGDMRPDLSVAHTLIRTEFYRLCGCARSD